MDIGWAPAIIGGMIVGGIVGIGIIVVWSMAAIAGDNDDLHERDRG